MAGAEALRTPAGARGRGRGRGRRVRWRCRASSPAAGRSWAAGHASTAIPGAEPARRTALAALYAALTVDVMLDKLGAAGPVLVEGSFHRNAAFCGLLAALRPGQPIHATDDPSGTARGAWLLARWDERPSWPSALPAAASGLGDRGPGRVPRALARAQRRSDGIAQDRGQRLAVRDVVLADAQDLALGQDHPAGDLVDHAVARGASMIGERDHARRLVDRAGDRLVDVDQQRIDGAERGGACGLGDVRRGAAVRLARREGRTRRRWPGDADRPARRAPARPARHR